MFTYCHIILKLHKFIHRIDFKIEWKKKLWFVVWTFEFGQYESFVDQKFTVCTTILAVHKKTFRKVRPSPITNNTIYKYAEIFFFLFSTHFSALRFLYVSVCMFFLFLLFWLSTLSSRDDFMSLIFLTSPNGYFIVLHRLVFFFFLLLIVHLARGCILRHCQTMIKTHISFDVVSHQTKLISWENLEWNLCSYKLIELRTETEKATWTMQKIKPKTSWNKP